MTHPQYNDTTPATITRTRLSALVLLTAAVITVPLFLWTRGPSPTGAAPGGGGATAVHLERFVAGPDDSSKRTMYGGVTVRDILTPATEDPLEPIAAGAVLTDLLAIRHGSLAAGKTTSRHTVTGRQLVFYVTAGTGRLVAGPDIAELRDGIAAVIPPDVPFTLETTGNTPLSLYIIEEPLARKFKPRTRATVRDEYDNPVSTSVRRVNRTGDMLLSIYDGLSTIVAINPVMWEPGSAYPPNVHRPGDEEIWLAVRGDMEFRLGARTFPLPEGHAYKVPADGRTPHVNHNPGDSSVKVLWIYKVPVRRVEVPGGGNETDGMI